MALQGNPFLGKLKIPAPDLSRIPDAPFSNQNDTLKGSQIAKEEPTTKLQQTHNKVATQPTTKLQQTHNKVTTSCERKNLPKEKTYNKLPTQLTTQPTTKLQQTHNKVTTKYPFLSLTGLQKKIVLFIYELCRSQGARLTDAVSISSIATSCKTTTRAAQETIRRLNQKGFILRTGYKNGRGGWTNYELPEDVYKELFQLETSNKVTTKLQQTPNKLPTQLTTELTTNLPSSSSIVLNKEFKTTTTADPDKNDLETLSLDLAWQQVDFTPLSEIGFTQTHLAQIFRAAKLSSDEVQDSIYFFAFDLSRNGKGRTLNGSPLNFFMGILRKGIPYAPPENYESPAEEARRRIREFKLRKEQELKAEEQQIVDLEFSEWKRSLDTGEITQLLPEFARRPGPLQDSTLRTYFETKVWPERNQKASIEDRNEVIRQIEQSLGEQARYE